MWPFFSFNLKGYVFPFKVAPCSPLPICFPHNNFLASFQFKVVKVVLLKVSGFIWSFGGRTKSGKISKQEPSRCGWAAVHTWRGWTQAQFSAPIKKTTPGLWRKRQLEGGTRGGRCRTPFKPRAQYGCRAGRTDTQHIKLHQENGPWETKLKTGFPFLTLGFPPDPRQAPRTAQSTHWGVSADRTDLRMALQRLRDFHWECKAIAFFLLSTPTPLSG